ncbi:sn-glycerol-3-phosphate ABC transporter ATP-binding protein UgpC [Vineibacter terrae]|uniref:sn-glycerol-3-phosphate ABC transporter ATP-binding protein UgpC n=1 Tax=Vineibacter terrae TaxID=2586908 RepID=A0A5C8P6C9_9HYPH|nr:sn-glycerol-3-phosphate ABC transporter ATP-binding protein UgpC [Vineibacter terrae]TXL69168.1 sn-glycerol-3-phosphate ABC transporter ATP-binding protein UgpC [Vineibacter terrae]
MAVVSLRALRKSYGPHEVVHGVDLEIRDEEFVVLVGPSGCGKSTILRMLAGLEDNSSGEIAIDGAVVNDKEPKDRDIAMVFQDYALYPHMSVFENMAFSLRYRGVDKNEIRRRVEEAARILDIGPLLERKPRQLSGGQRQRVAMGRAIVRKPKVFLFDEPLSNLDAKLRIQMRTEIKKLRERVRTTTVFVTHDQVEAMTLADRIVVLNSGVVLQVGTPEEIYDRPQTTFVAGFIGIAPMNLLPSRLERQDGHCVAVLPGGARLPLEPAQADSAPSRDVYVGLRPEHLEWAPHDDSGGVLAGPASVVEPLGSDVMVAFTVGDHDVQARLPPRTVRSTGAPVKVRVAPGNIHLFDRASEQRLGP